MANEKQQWSGTHTRNSCLMSTIKKNQNKQIKKTPSWSRGKNHKRRRAKWSQKSGNRETKPKPIFISKCYNYQWSHYETQSTNSNSFVPFSQVPGTPSSCTDCSSGSLFQHASYHPVWIRSLILVPPPRQEGGCLCSACRRLFWKPNWTA